MNLALGNKSVYHVHELSYKQIRDGTSGGGRCDQVEAILE